MVFSSPIFLFAFLPLTLMFYYSGTARFKNIILLCASLLFYAWGEVFYVAIMLVSIAMNYVVGLKIAESTSARRESVVLAVGIALNLLLLVTFKYANFIADNLNALTTALNIGEIDLTPVHLPLGISFFTFQAISYIVDVYRKEVPAQRNRLNLALYISLFPQLIAGPIVRYHDIASQIVDRVHSSSLFASGVRRFIFGLAKKMLLANPLGQVADSAFAMSGNDLTMPLAWIGIFAYALQIYFDFSGYSDMAIGLGRMFGFRFLENFNYPYISRSLREFWQRWHISLSTWFRDYLYIPMGGSRVAKHLVYRNLLLVFLLTGIWHGASWNFVVWGLFHGFFLTCEHMGFKHVIARAWRPIQHVYLLLVVLISWVFFRAENLSDALAYLTSMFNLANVQTSIFQFTNILTYESVAVLVVATVLATPIFRFLSIGTPKQAVFSESTDREAAGKALVVKEAMHKFMIVGQFGLFYLTILKVSSATYNPFIYFRF